MAPEPMLEAQLAAPAIAGSRRESFGRALEDTWQRHWDTLGTQVATAALGVMSGVLAPRLLGPQGRGQLAAVTLWPVSLAFLGMFGMDLSAVYFAARGRVSGSFGMAPVASTCLVVGCAQSLAVIAAGVLIIPAALHGFGPHAVRVSLLFLASVPFILMGRVLSGLLLGNQDTTGYNTFRLVAPATYSLAVLAFFLLDIPSVAGIVAFELAGFVLAASVVIRLVRSRLCPLWSWKPRIAKEMLKYGAKTQAGSVSNFFNQRLDQLLISLFLPSAELGLYVAAVALADGLLIIPRGIGLVTLAESANADRRNAWRLAKRSLLLTAFWLLPCAVGLWILAPLIVPALFGVRFAASVLPCRILIPGSCSLALATVLFEAARGMNHPEIPAYAEAAGLVLTAILLALLLKPYGISGAAVASALAYTFTFGITAVLLIARTRGEGI
jgi:O-antigen/teichoic acid export membrane protein